MAHLTEVVGKYSEVVAELALLANGFAVSRPQLAQPYDFKAEDPITGEEYKVQVKTFRRRHDRNNELVLYTTNGKGQCYDRSDVDYFIGVLGDPGESPRVWMFENEPNQREYWAKSTMQASKRWVELPLSLDRSMYEEKTEAEAV
ncbi:hypothetical protein [Bacillus velezensis]|uniref:hypothetical protein n=1 Tax=Bacillus velezensis TaxID=492670 RepID=UPI003BA920FA